MFVGIFYTEYVDMSLSVCYHKYSMSCARSSVNRRNGLPSCIQMHTSDMFLHGQVKGCCICTISWMGLTS